MAKCCDKHTTRFCPDCGKTLKGDLDTLLSFLKTHATKAKKFYEDRVSIGQEASFSKRTMEKWEGWLEAVENLRKKTDKK